MSEEDDRAARLAAAGDRVKRATEAMKADRDDRATISNALELTLASIEYLKLREDLR